MGAGRAGHDEGGPSEIPPQVLAGLGCFAFFLSLYSSFKLVFFFCVCVMCNTLLYLLMRELFWCYAIIHICSLHLSALLFHGLDSAVF